MATSTETLPRAEPRQIIDSDVLYEVIDGQIVEKPPLGAYQGWIANIVCGALRNYVRQRDLGRAVMEMLFDLAPLTRQRCPDVAFISYERWPKDRKIPRTIAWAVIPDLAIEVISPSNSMQDVLEKVHEYFQAGVRLVWVVLPNEEEVYIYRSPTKIEVRTRNEELTGDDVLPEFRLPLADLFEEGEDAPDETAQASATDEESQ